LLSLLGLLAKIKVYEYVCSSSYTDSKRLKRDSARDVPISGYRVREKGSICPVIGLMVSDLVFCDGYSVLPAVLVEAPADLSSWWRP